MPELDVIKSSNVLIRHGAASNNRTRWTLIKHLTNCLLACEMSQLDLL